MELLLPLHDWLSLSKPCQKTVDRMCPGPCREFFLGGLLLKRGDGYLSFFSMLAGRGRIPTFALKGTGASKIRGLRRTNP